MSSRLAALLLLSFSTIAMSKTSLLYIASQNPEKPGILTTELDLTTGALSAPKFIQDSKDPSHFEITPKGTHLYMCNSGTPGGVSAYAVDRKTGAL